MKSYVICFFLRSEDIVIHEVSHGLHLLGANYVISGFEERVKAAFNAAKQSGRWANTYSMSNDHEYFVSESFNAFVELAI